MAPIGEVLRPGRGPVAPDVRSHLVAPELVVIDALLLRHRKKTFDFVRNALDGPLELPRLAWRVPAGLEVLGWWTATIKVLNDVTPPSGPARWSAGRQRFNKRSGVLRQWR